MCVKDLQFDLIIENVPRARKPNDPNPEWGVVAVYHRYILTLVDYATRYPEAVPLKNIDTETVAEALLNMYTVQPSRSARGSVE